VLQVLRRNDGKSGSDLSMFAALFLIRTKRLQIGVVSIYSATADAMSFLADTPDDFQLWPEMTKLGCPGCRPPSASRRV
jgi:hypothetical protein